MKKIAQDYVYVFDGNTISTTDQHPECPYYTTKDVLEQRHYFDYDPESRKVIDLITIGSQVEPVGSSKYLVHKYPSDIDLFETVKGCCTINSVRLPMARQIQNIIRHLQTSKGIFFGRFQCGYDRRYDIYWGTERNGKVVDFNANIAKREIDNLRYQGLINDNERLKALGLVKDQPTINNFLRLYYFFRQFMALEWTEEEILRSYKEVRGNKRIYLDDALIDKSLVKLDVWAELPYPDMKNKKRYVEVTNWFLVQVEDGYGNVETLSIVQEDRIQSLRADIYKYNSDKYFDPLKASKRYWNYLFELKRDNKIEKELKKLAPLFSSYIAFLNSVLTDLDLQKKLLTRGLIDQNYYTQFMIETRKRMLNYAPSCYFDKNLNNGLAKSLNTIEIALSIDDLTVEYLNDNDIDMIDFIQSY